ncbi:MAG TPA: transglutaminase-like domain-containing protein [Rhizobiaceae bacterium]|nr:transglutaminase-like domain-containing protein [Rhizobiaceae bacterium]
MTAALGSPLVSSFTKQSPLTDPGRHAAAYDELPADPAALAAIVQGLLIYDVVAEPFYGYQPAKDRAGEIHARTTKVLLDTIKSLDPSPLTVPRLFERRHLARCHIYTRLFVSMLRAKDIPARARCGFGAYFNPPWFEDHWVAEYFDAGKKRWVLADAQLDAVWLEKLQLKADTLDLPRDQFVVAADAWKACRSGKGDPMLYGISFNDLRGLWFIAADLIKDVASLAGMEMLPWDAWGATPKPDAELSPDELRFFDRLADLTADPDAAMYELLYAYRSDARLTVPAQVFNALTQRMEDVPHR